MSRPTAFINGRLCSHGKLVRQSLYVSPAGEIIDPSHSQDQPLADVYSVIDLDGAIIAPGFIELQINGAYGFHFTHFTDSETYAANVHQLAKQLPKHGVTGFYPTIPTVTKEVFQKALPYLKPAADDARAASVLGAHVEGPFLAPAKKGAHDAANMHIPESATLESIYGEENLKDAIKVVTLAPELPGALDHIETLTKKYGIKVSMGHSAATNADGLKGIKAGASLLTHTFNAMNPLHHREPGLVGLISSATPPYFSLIADNIHLHPDVVALAYRSSPSHCILITDSIELAGQPDGLYPGHSQIPFSQRKVGNMVTIEGTTTLIGTCISLDECVRNLKAWAEIPLEEAVMCVTEHVADAMELKDRGKLEVGRRADLVILDSEGNVKETWIKGQLVPRS
ncbi:carbohydrate esterase family 9 protein [Xylogone sp. PMI_703]|nr:carbohydrate esterase family 9 protein [Xylogone sp. PMI_703]